MAKRKTLVVSAGTEVAAYGVCRWCGEDPADGLWEGKIWNPDNTRIIPYRGYVCEQCANNHTDETGHAGRWVRRWRATLDNQWVFPLALHGEAASRAIYRALYPPQEV